MLTFDPLLNVVDFYKLEARMLAIENMVSSFEITLKGITEKSFNILKTSNKHIKILINKMEATPYDKDEENTTEEQDATPGQGMNMHTRYSTRKRVATISPKEFT